MNSEGRRIMIVRFPNGKKKTIAYARYLMELNLNRYLNKNETVDHIDNNKLNDTIENLQILTRQENIRKSNPPARKLKVICKYCQREFTIRRSKYLYNKYIRKCDGPFCSKECVGKAHH